MKEVMAGFVEPFSDLKHLGSHWNWRFSDFFLFLILNCLQMYAQKIMC
jgi:hypothetical protein